MKKRGKTADSVALKTNNNNLIEIIEVYFDALVEKTRIIDTGKT
jgi:hypothetical protein